MNPFLVSTSFVAFCPAGLEPAGVAAVGSPGEGLARLSEFATDLRARPRALYQGSKLKGELLRKILSQVMKF